MTTLQAEVLYVPSDNRVLGGYQAVLMSSGVCQIITNKHATPEAAWRELQSHLPEGIDVERIDTNTHEVK